MLKKSVSALRQYFDPAFIAEVGAAGDNERACILQAFADPYPVFIHACDRHFYLFRLSGYCW